MTAALVDLACDTLRPVTDAEWHQLDRHLVTLADRVRHAERAVYADWCGAWDR